MEQPEAPPVRKKARSGLYNKFQLDPSPQTKSAETAPPPPALAGDDAANERRVSRWLPTRALSLLLCVAVLGLLKAWLTAAHVAMAQRWFAALVQLPSRGAGAVAGATRLGLAAVARAILGAVGLTWSPS